jgi:hypothetical protein
MAYAPDLATFSSLRAEERPLPCDRSERLLVVGWLQAGKEYARGRVSPEVFAKLRDLLSDPWQPFAMGGGHGCDLCQYEPEKYGGRNVFVPDGSRAFVAPEHILHYMNAHGYAPPADFCNAVMACPPMRSQAYRRALIGSGVNEWLRRGGIGA